MKDTHAINVFKQKNMKKISTLLLAAALGIASVSVAQQDPQFTQFMNAKQAYNPAYVGTSGSICKLRILLRY